MWLKTILYKMIKKEEEKKKEEKKIDLNELMKKMNRDNIFGSDIEVNVPDSLEDLRKEIEGLFFIIIQREQEGRGS